ncbi:hypothetical protein GCM10025857_24120 [Alicyclobacillus contaminans]|nr:hypothetical protein GCM10025857_24120 [Alicyclobacillus contaminans]
MIHAVQYIAGCHPDQFYKVVLGSFLFQSVIREARVEKRRAHRSTPGQGLVVCSYRTCHSDALAAAGGTTPTSAHSRPDV